MNPSRYAKWGRARSLFRIWIVVNCLTACATPSGQKVVIGAVETLRVRDADLAFRARIDTGAEASSIHATGVLVEGTDVSFTLENELGDRRALRMRLVDEANVRTAQGNDVRPRVALTLTLGDIEKRVLVSLRDRAGMEHRLLVGRDFLAGDFVVDVSRGDDR